MELVNLSKDIIRNCYSYKNEKIFSDIQCFIERIAKEKTLCEKMFPVFKIIMTGIEKKDIILLGDCFEYGIMPILLGNKINYELFNENLLSLPDIDSHIFYLETYSDEPALYIKNQNEVGYRINSMFSPEHEVSVWLEAQKIKKITPVVCLFGLGTGLFAEMILNNLRKDGMLIIFEPNRNIYEYCMASGSNKESCEAERKIAKRIQKVLKDKRVYNIVGDEDGTALQELLSLKLDYTKMKGMVIACHNNYNLVFPDSYEVFYNGISAFCNSLQTKINVEKYFKEYYLNNFLYNIYYIKKGIYYNEIGRVLPKDVPVIIVSAGPSLDKNIDILKQAKGHMLIVAVDSSLNILLKKGIIPDLTATIDPNKDEKCFSDEKSLEIPCLFSLDANRKLISKLKGEKIFLNLSDDYADSLFKLANKSIDMVCSNGGSVATTVFSVFSVFEQRKIILVGQDLAFVDGKTHAGGINVQLGYKESLVDGIYGDKVITRSDWLTYIKWFEKSIKTLKKQKKNIRVIDATEGGALIQGTEIMSLQEAIDGCKNSGGSLPKFDFREKLNQMEEYFTEEQYAQLLKRHREAWSELEEVENLSEDAKELCNKLMDGLKKESLTKACVEEWRNSIEKKEKLISSKPIYSLLYKYIECEIASDISELLLQDGDIRTIEINIIKSSKIKYEAIIEAARAVRNRIIDMK